MIQCATIRRIFCLPISCPLVSLPRPIARPRLVPLYFVSCLVLFALLWRSESTTRSIYSPSSIAFRTVESQASTKHRARIAFYPLCTISVTIVYEHHKSCQVYLFVLLSIHGWSEVISFIRIWDHSFSLWILLVLIVAFECVVRFMIIGDYISRKISVDTFTMERWTMEWNL